MAAWAAWALWAQWGAALRVLEPFTLLFLQFVHHMRVLVDTDACRPRPVDLLTAAAAVGVDGAAGAVGGGRSGTAHHVIAPPFPPSSLPA